MATLGTSGKVTLLDIAKAQDPEGNIAAVAELLTQTNEILLDMPFYEANSMTSHQSTIRTGLPTAIWRQFYQGVPASKSNRAKVEDTIGMLETRSELDVDIAKLNGNSDAFRLSEATAFLEAMNQNMAATVFYGSQVTNPERFNGLVPRFNAKTGAANSQNVLDATGAGADTTSIWLIVWGKETVFGTYPKGSQSGIYHQNLGEIDAFDGNSNRYRALADRWQWKCGLVVKDWRYIVRIVNVDIPDLVAQASSQASTAATAVIKLMVRAMARIPFMSMGRAVFYMTRTVKEFLAVAALEKSSAALAIVPATNQFGGVQPGWVQNETQFFGIPCRTCDQILTTETGI